MMSYSADTRYFRLFADCIPVKGAKRSAIYDLTRNELVFFPSTYVEVLDFLLSEKKLHVLLSELECAEEIQFVTEFIAYLDQQELVHLTETPELFPQLPEKWDIPATIQNAIIDVDHVFHDFNKIFSQLNQLGCLFVQIRDFSGKFPLENWDDLLRLACHQSFESIELLLKHSQEVPDSSYIQLVENHPILSSLTLHSATEERRLMVDFGCEETAASYIKKNIPLFTQKIDSHVHCGVLRACSLTVNN